MKKVLLLLLALTLSFTLAACGEDEDRTAPVIEGADDVTIYMNESFDPMEGVTATNHEGDDITSEIEVEGAVDTSATGTSYLKYKVEDSEGLSSEAARYVTVEVDPANLGDEMVPNGDFSLGFNLWNVTQGNEGGAGDFTVVDGELKADITAVSATQWEPRLENNGIEFEQDGIYEVTFEARAVDPRAINIQVGELLDGAPWFNDFKPGITAKFDLTTEMQSYSFSFVMDQETNEGSLLFEFGTSEHETTGTDNLFTTVYLDNVEINELDEYVDDAEPLITGADDAEVIVGESFDPLAGVTVTDNVDGDITLTADHVTGTVDTDTIGEYVLTYTVSDEAGNETVLERTILVQEEEEDPGLYTADYGWRSFLNDWDGTAGDTAVNDNGEFVLSLSALNVYEGWHVQLIQDAYALGTGEDNEGSLEFEEGASYRVTFDAKASTNGTFKLAIGHGEWTPYFEDDTKSVTSTMQTFTYEFTLDDDAMDYSTPAQFKLELGGLFTGATAPQEFVLDNVVIEKMGESAYEPTDLIVNGTFEREVDPTIQADYGWRTFLNDLEGTAGSASVVDGAFELSLTAINAHAGWTIQIIQDAVALGTGENDEGSVVLEHGESYRVTFDAKASMAGTMKLAIGNNVGGWTEYVGDATQSVTTSMETYTYEFTVDDDAMDYTVPAQFKIELGDLFNGADAPQTFTLDNVSIAKHDGTDYVATDLIVNGDFTEEDDPRDAADYGWRTFLNDWDGTVGSADVVSEEYVLSLSELNVYEGWHVQLIQDAFALNTGEDNEGSIIFETDATYRVSFDAKSSTDGAFKLAIGHAGNGWTGYYEDVTQSVTSTMQTFTYEFTLDNAEADYSVPAQFKLELGGLFTGATGPQTFTLDNVVIEKQVDGTFEPTELIINGDFSN